MQLRQPTYNGSQAARAHLTILVVFLGVLITWTLGRNLHPRLHKARTDWKHPCRYNVQQTRSPNHTEENSSCSVSDIIGKWIPELNIVFKEIIWSLDEAINAYTRAHGFEPSHVKIEELDDPTNNVTFDKLINRENNAETEKIIYRNYSSLTILAAYLNLVNNSDELINNYGKHLSDAIRGIRGALCKLRRLADGLALDDKDVFPKIDEFSHHFQTESDSQLMNLNETVLTYGQKILANLTATLVENVASSLRKCTLNCDKKKRRLLCKNSRAKRQRKGKGKKNKSKKQRKNKKDKGRNRSS